MFGRIRGVIGAMALSLAVTASAEAQLPIDRSLDAAGSILTTAGSSLTGTSCIAGYSLSSFNFQECSGAWAGNNNGNSVPAASEVQKYVESLWSFGGNSFDVTNTTGMTGEFVLAVKGSTSFSLYYFANHDGSSLDFLNAMAGVSTNSSPRRRRCPASGRARCSCSAPACSASPWSGGAGRISSDRTGSHARLIRSDPRSTEREEGPGTRRGPLLLHPLRVVRLATPRRRAWGVRPRPRGR